jgi:hypothetical protein
MTLCGLANIYQHLEDLVTSMSITVEKDFDTLNSVRTMVAAGCCETSVTSHKSTLRFIVDEWNIQFLKSPQLVSVSEHTYITMHLYLASSVTGVKN